MRAKRARAREIEMTVQVSEERKAIKSLWRSKTFWANAVVAIVLGVMPLAEANLSVIKELMSPVVYYAVGLIMCALNIGLRLITSTAVSVRGE